MAKIKRFSIHKIHDLMPTNLIEDTGGEWCRSSAIEALELTIERLEKSNRGYQRTISDQIGVIKCLKAENEAMNQGLTWFMKNTKVLRKYFQEEKGSMHKILPHNIKESICVMMNAHEFMMTHTNWQPKENN